MVVGPVADFKATEVKLAQALQRGVDFFPGGLGARALEAFNQHFGGSKPFQHGWADLTETLGFGQVECFLHHGVGHGTFVGVDLGHDHPSRIGAQALDEPCGGIVGERDDLCGRPGCPKRIAGIHHRRARCHHQHRLGVGAGQFDCNGSKVGFGTVELLQHNRGELAGGQAFLGADDAVCTKTVVGIHHRDACHAHGCQVGHGLFRLALIGGAHVEDVFAHGLVQHHGAGGWADQRHAVLLQQRDHGFCVRGAAGQKHCEHVLLFNQLAGVFTGEFGVELVVQRDEFNFLSVHATLRVDRVEVQHCTVRSFLDARRDLAGISGGLSDQDLCVAGADQCGQCSTGAELGPLIHRSPSLS